MKIDSNNPYHSFYAKKLLLLLYGIAKEVHLQQCIKHSSWTQIENLDTSLGQGFILFYILYKKEWTPYLAHKTFKIHKYTHTIILREQMFVSLFLWFLICNKKVESILATSIMPCYSFFMRLFPPPPNGYAIILFSDA